MVASATHGSGTPVPGPLGTPRTPGSPGSPGTSVTPGSLVLEQLVSPAGDDIFVVRAGADLTDDDRISDLLSCCSGEIERTALHGSRSRLLVDLAATERANSKLIACMIVVVRTARQRGVVVELKLSPLVEHWLKICRLDWLAQPTVS